MKIEFDNIILIVCITAIALYILIAPKNCNANELQIINSITSGMLGYLAKTAVDELKK